MRANSAAIILVGGPLRGTRFRPLSLEIPKPLFEVAGKPMIYHHISALAKIQSLTLIFLIGFYAEEVFHKFLCKVRSDFPHIMIKYLREYQPMGTAGGIFHFRDSILEADPEFLFVLSADVCCSFPLEVMLQHHIANGAKATIMGTKVPLEIASSFGCIVANQENSVIHYVEKPDSAISNIISCGIYVFNPGWLIKYIKKCKQRIQKEQINMQQSEHLSLEQDVISPLSQEEEKVLSLYITSGYWRQIKTASNAVPANALYLNHMAELNDPSVICSSNGNNPQIIAPVYIHPDAQIHPTAKIGPFVSIGRNAFVGPGVRIRNSIILEETQIQEYACVLDTIMAKNCLVGSWARVEGWLSADNHVCDSIMKNGVKMEDVTVCASNVTIESEVRVANCVVLPHKDIKKSVVGQVIM